MGALSITLLLPLLGAVIVGVVLPKEDTDTAKKAAVGTTALTFLASLWMLVEFNADSAAFQLTESFAWIPALNANISLSVDGIAVTLILLTTFLTPLVLLAAWDHDDRVKGYFTSFLVLEFAVLGVFMATDLLLFYVFWEVMLVPMYLIIGIWGGKERRYASLKFFLYTLLGGLLMLVAIVWIYGQTGTFSYEDAVALDIGVNAQRWLFWAFVIAFAVKIPLFPVHTWLPDAHTQAPTGGSVILAGVLLKMGGFGLLRYALPLFPDAAREAAPILLTLSVIGILYGAVVALMQKDIKKLVAYSSVSHMGFVVLGIFALNTVGTSAGVVQMINHGLSTGALFLLVGFLYERRHTRMIAAFGGLAKQTPVYAALFLVVAMSSLALPGLNGFVGEFPILLGVFQTNRLAGVLAAFGAVLAALYLLWAYQRMFHGPLEGADNENTMDLTKREIAIMVPLIALIVAIGIYPKPLYDHVTPSVDRLLTQVGGADVDAAAVGSVSVVDPAASTEAGAK